MRASRMRSAVATAPINEPNNVWKPLYRRVEELPLAMIDARTHDDADLRAWS